MPPRIGSREFAHQVAEGLGDAPVVNLVDEPAANKLRRSEEHGGHPLVVVRSASDTHPVSVRETATGAEMFFTFSERTPSWDAFTSDRFSRDGVERLGELNLHLEGHLATALDDPAISSDATRRLRDAIMAYSNEEEFEW